MKCIDLLKIRKLIGAALWIVCFLTVSMACQSKSKVTEDSHLPEYQCHFVNADITITGKIDNPLWQKVEVIQLGNPIDGKPGRFATKVRLLYSDKYLYIAFECEDDSVWGTLTGHDEAIFNEECVEAFICPSGKMRQYYEINVSPLNTVFDALILNGRPTNGEWANFRTWKDFTCEGLQTKVHVNGELGKAGAKGWTAEYAIPFSAIIGSDNLVPVNNETWRINFYRIDTPRPKQSEFYAWSQTGANDFHRPWAFGYLKFVKPETK